MNLDNIEYLIDNLSSLCGIPTRIYENDNLIYYSSFITFKKDPILLDEKELLKHKEHVGYYINDSFFNYGVLNYQQYEIIVGPFCDRTPSNQELQKIAFNLEINRDDTQDFIESMKMIISMPLSSVIQSLCMLNFILNEERLAITDIIIDEKIASSNYDVIKSIMADGRVDEQFENNANSAYILEKEIERIVEHGEIDNLANLFKNPPSSRSGVLSNNEIRHYKNIFIVTATVVSRAAIKGGLSQKEAFKQSDLYIQKMELLNTLREIQSLQASMVRDYTSLVAKIKGKKGSSELLINLNKYIIDHISDAIKIEDVCKALYISKSALFEHVKKETGLTVSSYILQTKINESKGLLKYTSKKLAAISLYLGFSSQSHFNRTFKIFTGMTPLEYKNTHRAR